MAAHLIGSFLVHLALLTLLRLSPAALASTRLAGDGTLEPRGPLMLAIAVTPPDGVAVEAWAEPAAEMGITTAESEGRHALAGPDDNPDPHFARWSARWWAPRCCTLGPAVPAPPGGQSPRVALGRDDALGAEPLGAVGERAGAAVADVRGREGWGESGAAGLGAVAAEVAAPGSSGRGYRCRLP